MICVTRSRIAPQQFVVYVRYHYEVQQTGAFQLPTGPLFTSPHDPILRLTADQKRAHTRIDQLAQHPRRGLLHCEAVDDPPRRIGHAVGNPAELIMSGQGAHHHFRAAAA